jgi:hypothetical protein
MQWLAVRRSTIRPMRCSSRMRRWSSAGRWTDDAGNSRRHGTAPDVHYANSAYLRQRYCPASTGSRCGHQA